MMIAVQLNDEIPMERDQVNRISYIPSVKKKTASLHTQSIDEMRLELDHRPIEDVDPLLAENDTGIKKAFDFARRLKNGEEDLIDFREVKNNFITKASKEFQKIRINRNENESDD